MGETQRKREKNKCNQGCPETVITIWDPEEIVQVACQLFMHLLSLVTIIKIYGFIWGLEIWLLEIRSFQGMYTEGRLRSVGVV